MRRVEADLALQTRLRDRLVRILDVLDADAEPSLDQLIDTIEVMTLHEKYYTPEQLRQLEQRRNEIGEDEIKRVEQEWQEIYARLRELRDEAGAFVVMGHDPWQWPEIRPAPDYYYD